MRVSRILLSPIENFAVSGAVVKVLSLQRVLDALHQETEPALRRLHLAKESRSAQDSVEDDVGEPEEIGEGVVRLDGHDLGKMYTIMMINSKG